MAPSSKVQEAEARYEAKVKIHTDKGMSRSQAEDAVLSDMGVSTEAPQGDSLNPFMAGIRQSPMGALVSPESHQLASGAVKGAAQTAGFMADAINYGTRPLTRAITGKEIPFGRFSQGMGELAEQIPGMAGEPQTMSEQFSNKAGEFTGASLLPISKAKTLKAAISELIAAQTGGWGSAGAKAMGAGPVGQVVAGLGFSSVPSITRLARRAYKSFGDATPQAQRVLNEAAPELAAKLDDIQQGPFNKQRTTAELTDDAGMAGMENEIGNRMQKRDPLKAKIDERNRAQDIYARRVVPGPQKSKFTVGENIRGKITKESEALKKKVDKAYAAIDPDGVTNISIGPELKAVRKEIKQRFGNVRPIKGENNKLYSLLSKFDETTKDGARKVRSFDELQIMRGWANDLMATATPNEQAVLLKVRNGIDGALDRTAKTGEGFSPSQLQQFNKAKELRTDYANRFENKFSKKVTRKGEGGDYQMLEQNVVDAVKSGNRNTVEQFRKSVKGDPELLRQTRKAVVMDIVESSTKDSGFSHSTFTRQLRKNRDSLEALFEPTHIAKLDTLAKELHGVVRLRQLKGVAASGQSATKSNQTIAADLANLAVNGKTGLMASAGSRIHKALKGRNAEDVNDLLWQAAMDPKKARLLLEAPTHKNLNLFFNELMRDESLAGLVIASSEND